MFITHITSLSQLEGLISGSKLSVIDFHATWCGPCHAIAPKYEALAKEYTGVQFLKCDVDACQDVARAYSITAMPSFVFIKNGTKVDVVRGADPRALESTIKKHAGSGGSSSSGVFVGKGNTVGGAKPSPTAGKVTPTYAEVAEGVTNIDPQLKLLVGFVTLYLLYWYYKG